MKNILNFFFFIIFLFKSGLVFAECNFNTSNYIKELANSKNIKSITITTSQTQKFNKNFSRIITSEGLNIPPNLKKKILK